MPLVFVYDAVGGATDYPLKRQPDAVQQNTPAQHKT